MQEEYVYIFLDGMRLLRTHAMINEWRREANMYVLVFVGDEPGIYVLQSVDS